MKKCVHSTKLLEEEGWPGKAIEQYGKFYDLLMAAVCEVERLRIDESDVRIPKKV